MPRGRSGALHGAVEKAASDNARRRAIFRELAGEGEAENGPEVIIVVRQVVNGRPAETSKRLDLRARADARMSLADHLLDEALAEMRRYVEEHAEPEGDST